MRYLMSAAILLLGLAACSTREPRSVANPGVAQAGRAAAPNTAYYTGADPDFPRAGSRGSKGGP